MVGGVGYAAEMSGISAGGYMSTNRWMEARVRDTTYMEVGGGEGSTFQLKEKEAYTG